MTASDDRSPAERRDRVASRAAGARQLQKRTGAAERAAALAEAARGGDRRALARLLTEVENRTAAGEAALRELYAQAGRAHLVGITGAPGAGKSTLVAALVGEARRDGRPVAVLAVDPSSPITGGAILGDRVRMQLHASDADVFIRSMASRGHAGGLAGTTLGAAAVLDACGFALIFIETVGTGQSEVEVASVADTTVVVQAPEMGDEVQAIKAGLLEVADIIAVNKGDRPGADRAARQLRAMLSTAGGRIERTPPQVMVTTATTADGVAALADAIDAHRFAAREPMAARDRAAHQVRRALADLAARRAEGDPAWEATVRAVADRDLDPVTAAERLLE